jgi:hypothetical protein
MTLTQILEQEAEAMFATTEALFGMVEGDMLNWKPKDGTNWMTTAQLLRHCSDACGAAIKGFVSGDWGLPPGVKLEALTPEQMMPPAEVMGAVKSVAEALELLRQDKETARKYIAEAGEANLLTKKLSAPWGGPEMTLFQHLYHMVGHLGQHKGQLFYYLKLYGKNVNTGHLWGM